MKRNWLRSKAVFFAFPLFWQLCRRCKKEFKLEYGWWTADTTGSRIYVCNGCAATSGVAQDTLYMKGSNELRP